MLSEMYGKLFSILNNSSRDSRTAPVPSKANIEAAKFIEACHRGDPIPEIATNFPNLYLQRTNWAEKTVTEVEITKGASHFNGDLHQKNYWLFGTPGIGKTRFVYEFAANNHYEVYSKFPNKWWDGYKPGKYQVVLINDWTATHECTANQLLQWADRASIQVETKGGFVTLAVPCFYLFITSNVDLRTAIQHESTYLGAKRRIHEINFDDLASISHG
jgi:hypothetical protein